MYKAEAMRWALQEVEDQFTIHEICELARQKRADITYQNDSVVASQVLITARKQGKLRQIGRRGTAYIYEKTESFS